MGTFLGLSIVFDVSKVTHIPKYPLHINIIYFVHDLSLNHKRLICRFARDGFIYDVTFPKNGKRDEVDCARAKRFQSNSGWMRIG